MSENECPICKNNDAPCAKDGRIEQLEMQLEQKCKSEKWYSERVKKLEDGLELTHDKILHPRDYLRNHAPKSAEYEIILEAIQIINKALNEG